jgi:hypothetical protein
MENVRGKGPHIRSSQDWASASQQGESTHGFLPSAIRNGKQLGCAGGGGGPTITAQATSNLLFSPNMKIQLTKNSD